MFRTRPVFIRNFTVIFTAAAMAGFSALATAEEAELQEVIVTAQKRAANI